VAGQLERSSAPRDLLASLRPAHVRVDLERLAQNYRAVAGFSGLPIMAVVKADAYGHGAAQVARCFARLGASSLAVAFPEEGVALRRAGVKIPIVVLGGFGEGQADILMEEDLTPVLSTEGSAEAFLAACRRAGRTRPVHLEVDTGMGRLGFPSRGLGERAARLLEAGGVELQGVMTHLPVADEDKTTTERHLDLFDACLADLEARGMRPPLVHASHSAGLFYLRKTHTLVRPGLLLYGLKPRPLSPEISVSPVMSVHARVVLLKDVPTKTPISYGGRWVAERPSRIATIPLGYADGVPRTHSMETEGSLLVKGRRAPIAGRVCMDFVMADVTDVRDVGEGDLVTLFGDDPTAWDVAGWAGTNAWEILTGVGSRLARVYVEGDRVVAMEGPSLS
jgi:alanine racemase